METRLCRTCHIDKPLEEFYMCDGKRKVHCKKCFIEVVREVQKKKSKKKYAYIKGQATVSTYFNNTEIDDSFRRDFTNWNEDALYC